MLTGMLINHDSVSLTKSPSKAPDSHHSRKEKSLLP